MSVSSVNCEMVKEKKTENALFIVCFKLRKLCLAWLDFNYAIITVIMLMIIKAQFKERKGE